MNETQYISDFLAPRDAWDKLSIEEQAAMMKTAISEGILDLNTIRQKYNEFAEGGNTDDDLVDWIIREEGFIANPRDIGDGKMTLGSGLTAQKWHDQYKRNGNKWTSSDNRRAVREEVANRRRWAERNIPNWDSLPSSSQKALLSYKYNYDFNRTNSPKLFKALSDSNLQEAARQMDATSSNPIFKKGLQDRRQREQEWFLKDTVPQQVQSGNYLPAVSTQVYNPYIQQVEATRMLPIDEPDPNSYIRTREVSPQEQRRRKFQENVEAFQRFNALMDLIDLSNNPAPSYNPIYSLIGGNSDEYANGGKIHIKPENRGKFTALKERTGHSATWFKEHGTPAQKKMAVFALNSRHWKHGLGGNLFLTGGPEERGREGVTNLSVWDELAAQSPLLYTIGKAVDPTGISGYGDAREAINQYDNVPSLNNGYTAVLETLGALPIVSKAGKAIKFLQGAVTGQGIFDDYNHAQEKMKEYGNELVVDYWDNTVKPRWEAEKHGEQMKSKMSYTDVHHVPSFKLAPKGSKPGQVISNYAINHRVVNKYKKALGGNLFDGTAEDSQQMQIGLKATNGWKPYTLDDILANATRIEQQKQAMKDRLNNVFILSNDASSVANGRLQNRHLERRTVEGAKQHAAWEKEHPVLNTIGTALGASPFAVAATPLLAAAGEAAAPVLTNPYVDAALTSGFGTHGLNHAINEGIDGWGDAAMTTLEVTPLGRLAVPITSKIMGNIADHSMNILRGDSPVEFVGSLYNYARRKPISFAEKQAAANRMETFIHSPEYIERQKAAGLSDSEIVDFQSMVSRRLNGGNFPAYTMKRKTSGLSLTLPKPFGGVYMREGIPYSDFLNAFDHEVAHYSTVNFGKSDNEFIKWLNRENPSVMEKVMNYNINSVPYRPESDVSKIRTARGLSPTTKNLNYYRNEQELRSNAYSMLQEAERRGISVDDLVDHYTMQSTGEIFGFAPAPLRYLNYAYTPENIKKYTKGFLSFATPLTFGIKYMNQDAK